MTRDPIKHDDVSPSTDAPAALALTRAVAPPVSRRQRAAYLIGGTLAAAGLGAGVGAYAIGMLSQDQHFVTVRCADTTPPTPLSMPPAAAIEVAPTPPPPGPGAIELGLVAETDATYVLLTAAVDESWMHGAPRAHGEGVATALSREVDLAALPPELAAAVGEEVALYGTEGKQCTAEVTGLEVLGRYIDDGYIDEEGSARWDAAAGSFQLAARVAVTDGDCGDAIWARSTSLPAPALAEVSDAPASLRATALEAFRALPAYRDLQADAALDGDAPWDTYAGAEAGVRVVRAAGTELVIVESRVGGCGEFEGSLVAIWRRDARGSLTPVRVETEAEPFAIDAAADLDGDGQPELFYNPDGYDRGVLRSDDGDYVVAEEAHVPIYGCRC